MGSPASSMISASRLLSFAMLAATVSAKYDVKFEVANLDDKSTGSFTMEVHEEWAPTGAARFKEMVEGGFFKDIAFFRVIEGFMAQFGISGDPSQAAIWRGKVLQDDPVIESNKAGYVSFA